MSFSSTKNLSIKVDQQGQLGPLVYPTTTPPGAGGELHRQPQLTPQPNAKPLASAPAAISLRVLKAQKMSSAKKAWTVAESIAAVDALKDQGFCRWNSAIRSLQQYGKTHFRTFSQAHDLSSSSSSTSSAVVSSKVEVKQSEESLRTVMYLSCWSSNS